MSLDICKDLDKDKHIEEVESDNDEEYQDDIESWEDVPTDMMV